MRTCVFMGWVTLLPLRMGQWMIVEPGACTSSALTYARTHAGAQWAWVSRAALVEEQPLARDSFSRRLKTPLNSGGPVPSCSHTREGCALGALAILTYPL